MTALTRPHLVIAVIVSSPELHWLRPLLDAVPSDQQLTFLLIGDAPTFETLRDEAESPRRLPTLEAERGGMLAPNAVYRLRVSELAGTSGGQFQFAPGTERATRAATHVDPFLLSLLAEFNTTTGVIVEQAAIDAGWVSDETLSRVTGTNGLVLVYDAEAQEFVRRIAGMSGTPDYTVPVRWSEVGETLLEHAEPLLSELRPAQASSLYRELEGMLPELCQILHATTGHDFRHYKSSTLVRRALRRVHLTRANTADVYLKRLRDDQLEARRLFNDVLISVTSFFRDIEAFDALAAVALPRIFEDRAPEDAVRIWVAGCATGEEAYSIAMLIREYAARTGALPPVQIFATDIDEEALNVARRGLYSPARLAHVSNERLSKFFARKGEYYQVDKSIRDMVLFSVHNLTNDPPFSRLDLISCRNLLIYLGDALHSRLIPLFHYALRPGGILFLGPSETLTTHTDLFRALDAKHRISQRSNTVKAQVPLLAGRSGVPATSRPSMSPASMEQAAVGTMQRVLGEEFTPKGVVVTEEGRIITASGEVEEFLTVPAGPFSNSITRLVRDGLRVAVRAALREAVALKARVVHDGSTSIARGSMQRVSVSVQPMPLDGDASGLYLVVFQHVGQPVSPNAPPTPLHMEATASLIEQLEHDLASTREDLQKTVQDLEAANEELKSSNEELLSMNEELQSANEELESSKEELQSTNLALAASKSDLENLLVSTQIPTIFLDDDGRVRRATPAAGKVYNVTELDVGRPLEHFTHAAREMPALPTLAELHASDRAIESEIEMRDGTTYLRRVLPYRDWLGAANGIVLTFVDITDRRRFEQSIRESEGRFRQLAETIPQLAWIARPDGEIIWFNKRFYEYTGETAERVTGRGWQAVYDAEVLPGLLERWRESLRDSAPLQMVLPIRGADGVYRPFDTRMNPLLDESGQVALWFGTNTDVSEEWARAEAGRRQQRELRTLTDSIPDIVSRIDREYRYVFVNAAAEKITGQAANSFLGRRIGDYSASGEVSSRVRDAVEQVFTTAAPQAIDFALDDPASGRRYFDSRFIPELGANGEVESVLAITRDRTVERVALDLVSEANRRKDEFLATLAHELRNPLAPIRNGIELLRMAETTAEQSVKVRDVMSRQVQHMTRLIDDLLDISRISWGKVELRKEYVAIQAVVDSAIEIGRVAIEHAQHTLVVELPDEPLVLHVDPTRLSQVLGNLLLNAAKYTPRGGRITLSATREAGQCVVRVTDSGMGIPEPMLNRVFELFLQLAHTNPSVRGGLGIGLSLAKQLVELHGGTISASSPGLDAGSTFTVRLPIATAPVTSGSTTDDGELGRAATRPLRIAVVDDNEDAALSLATLLTYMGYDTRTAFTGEAALALLPQFAPDVAFLDIGLPDINGYELASTVRREGKTPGITLIALTGWGSEDDRRRSQEAGFDYHLTKPAETRLIKRILASVPAV